MQTTQTFSIEIANNEFVCKTTEHRNQTVTAVA
jgi:hypothetical protein